ncbi:MAG: TonB-dependent receptor [Gemmatimonadaceae bacterium]|nr:TonB-dependent receptor [Gemmatimonadaceae bacterium]
MSRFRVRHLPLVALSGLIAVPVQGQQVRTDSAAQRIEPQVVRSARGAIVVGGASALVVKPDSARLAPAPTLGDLLRTIPLVLVRTNSRGEVELSVRGSESRQVGISLNGLPLSQGWDGRADPSLIPLTGISQVSYVRSTATVLGGPNTLGGVLDLSFESAPVGHRDQQLSLGTDQTGARLISGGVAATRPLAASQLSWRFGAGMRQRDGLVIARGVDDPITSAHLRTNSDSRTADLFTSVAWRADNGAAVSGFASGYDAMRGVAPELHVPDPRYWRYPEQSRRTLQLRAQTPRVTSRFGTTELEVGGGVLRGTTRIRTFTNATFSTQNGAENGEEQVNNARLVLSHAFRGGVQLKAAVTGNNILYDERLNGAAASHYRQDLLSAGVEANVLVGARTLVSGGVVLDQAVTIAAGGRPPLPSKSLTGFRLGATRQVGASARVHASASRRGRFPALRELYSGSLNRFEPNPGLRPENLIAVEAGASFGDADRPRGLTAQLIGFHHWLDDGIVRTNFATTTRFIRVNRDETRAAGMEALLGWRGGDTGPSITLDLVAQTVNIRDITAGGADRKPEHMPSVRAMLDGTMPIAAGVVVGANLAHIGNQYCVNPNSGNDDLLTAQTIGGFTAHRNFAMVAGGFRTVRILAGLDNVTNAAVYEQCGLPRAGRTLRLGFDLR